MRHTECMRHTQSRTVRVPFKVCVRAREPGMEPGTLRPCHTGSSCYDPVATHIRPTIHGTLLAQKVSALLPLKCSSSAAPF